VAEGQRSASKTVLGPGRISLSPVSYVVPSLQFEKEKLVKSPDKDNVARGASRGRTHVISRWPCHKGRRHRDTKKPSYPRTRKTTDRILRKTLDQEVAKRASLSTNKLQDVIYWTFWKVWPSPKRKKEVQTA
jgi:hypothetical protein